MNDTELPDVKKYHLILVPVEGAHGGFVRVEDYRNMETTVKLANLTLAEQVEDIRQMERNVGLITHGRDHFKDLAEHRRALLCKEGAKVWRLRIFGGVMGLICIALSVTIGTLL